MPRGVYSRVPRRPRIGPEEVRWLREQVFRRAVFSGSDLARRLGRGYHTVREWFYEIGLNPYQARCIAGVLRAWSAELAEDARRLEAQADALDPERTARNRPGATPARPYRAVPVPSVPAHEPEATGQPAPAPLRFVPGVRLPGPRFRV